MGCFQAVKPVFGEEGVGPALMVGASTTAFLSHPLAEKAPQSHANPAVEPLERPLMAVLEVCKPATKRRVERGDDREKAVAGATRRLATNRVLELLKALRPGSARAVLEPNGLFVHLRLLSTPPRGDAVTLGYKVPEHPGKDSHLADSMHLQAHSATLCVVFVLP